MKLDYQVWRIWIEQHSFLKRLLLLTLLVIVIFYSWQWLMQQTILQDKHSLERQAAELQANIQRFEEQAHLIIADGHAQTQPHLRDQHRRLNAKKVDLDLQLQHYETALSRQPQVATAFKTLLQEVSGLEMLRLSATAAAPLESQGNAELQNVIKQDFTLVLQGNYFAVLKFFQQAQVLDGRIFWDAMDYQVVNYPQAQVTIRLHTLSAKEA